MRTIRRPELTNSSELRSRLIRRREETRRRKRLWLLRALSGVRSIEAMREGIAWRRETGFLRADPLTLPPYPPRTVIPGAIHAHSTFSDGAGAVEEVIRAAEETGIQFLVLSDHHTLRALREGWEGVHGGVNLLVGAEVRTDCGYLLIMGVPGSFDPSEGEARSVIARVRDAGGLAFAALSADPIVPWDDWDCAGLHGLEILNLHSLGRRAASLPGMARFAALMATGRTTDAMRQLAVRPVHELLLWDRLLKSGRAAGIAAVDAHGAVRIGRRVVRVPEYAHSFRTVQTHVVTRSTASCASSPLPRERLLQALGAGNSRMVYAINGDALDFRYYYSSSHPATEGETAIWEPAGEICVYSPHELVIHRLYRDGRLVGVVEGTAARYPCPSPGVYRLETDAYSGGSGSLRWDVRPWVISNPIYVAPRPGGPITLERARS